MTPFLTTFLFLLFCILPGIVAARLSGFFFGESEWWRRALAAVCIYPLIIWAALMLLAPFALMTVWPVFVLMIVLAGLAAALPAVAWNFGELDRESVSPWWQVAIGSGLVVAGMCVFLFSNYATGTQFMSDDFAYHGPTISAWFRTGTLDHPRTVFASYYPFNGHMITLYALLPTGDLRWSWLGQLPWLVLGCASLVAMTRSLPGYRLGWGLLSAVIFLVCSEVAWYHFYSLCPTDVVGAGAFLAGLVVGIPRAGASKREACARAFLAAAMLGFAMGSKSTFALPGLVGGFGLLMMTIFGPSPYSSIVPRVLKSAGWMALGGFATGSYWYLWNWIHADNPVFPARVWKFSGPGHEKSWGDSTLLHHIQEAQGSEILWEILGQAIAFPWYLGMMSIAGLIFCVWFIVRQMIGAFRERDWTHLGHPFIWFFAAGASLVVQYPFMPFSGSFLSDYLVVNHRYFLVLFLLGFITLCWILSYTTGLLKDPMMARVVDGILFVAFAIVTLIVFYRNTWTIGSTQTVPAMIAGGVVTIALLIYGRGDIVWPPRIAPPVVALLGGGGVLLLCVLGGVRERILPPPYMTVHNIPWTRPVPPIIEAVDQLPDGSRIGEFSMNSWEYWYLCGSRMQHTPVVLWEQGLPLPPVHVVYDDGLIDEGYPRFGLPRQRYLPNPDAFTDNLRTVDIDYVLVTRYDSGVLDGAWPPQRQFIQRMPEFELVWSHEHSEIYRRLPDSIAEPPAEE